MDVINGRVERSRINVAEDDPGARGADGVRGTQKADTGQDDLVSRPRPSASTAWKRPSLQQETVSTSVGGRPMYSLSRRSKRSRRSPAPSQLAWNTSSTALSSAAPTLGWRRLIVSMRQLGGAEGGPGQVEDELVLDGVPSTGEPALVFAKFPVAVDQVDEGRWLLGDPVGEEQGQAQSGREVSHLAKATDPGVHFRPSPSRLSRAIG